MKIKHILRLLVFAQFFIACDDENYMTFDTNFSGIYFNADSTIYSFSVTPLDVHEYTLKVPVQIMGAPADVDRPIGYEFISDLCTATEGVEFLVDKAIVPAHSITGEISFRLLRDNLEGDHVNGYTRYHLYLRLTDNGHFTPTLDSLSQVHHCKFDNAIEQPEWLNRLGEKVWLKSTLGIWHPYKLIKMVEYFHAFEKIQPLTYKKMVELYGENLEHIENGNPITYGTTFRRYIYKPMYDHFIDPANRDMILALYPDFPFDFPNPYPSTNE
jgi:hypothetical protein